MANYIVFILILARLSFSLKQNGNFLRTEANRLMTSNNVQSALYITSKPEKSALINLKIKNTDAIFSIGSHQKQFVLMSSKDFKIISANRENVNLSGNTLMTNSLNITGEVKYNNISQWRLISHDNFQKNNTSLNWSHDKTTQCNSHKILGGYCQTSKKEVTKDYAKLPGHSQIRIEANYHFLGQWESNSGYLRYQNPDAEKKDDNYLWVQRCKNQKSPMTNINLCSTINVCKLAVPINSTINHKGKRLRLIFGSSLEGNPCDQSFGISDVKIYIR